MEKFEYITAQDLDRAWLNFELDLRLEPSPDGSPNPFYVDRPGNPVACAICPTTQVLFLGPSRLRQIYRTAPSDRRPCHQSKVHPISFQYP
jgi:hypothetical protein